MPKPRIPTNIHKLKGTYRPIRHDERMNEPKPNADIGNPPTNLSKKQKACWKEIVKITPNGVLTNADRITIELIACLLTDFRENYLEFSGAKLARLESMLGKIGLNPSDRSKVIIEPVEKPIPTGWESF